MGAETFVEGLGLPLTWSMAVLHVLLLLFSVFLFTNSIFTDFLMHFLLFFALVIRFLCTFYALFVHFLCASYALFIHFLSIFYALFMHFLCVFSAPLKSAQKVQTLFKKVYALFMRFLKAHKKRIKSA